MIRPRPPASQNLASDRAANLADRQQIRRLLSAPARSAAPAASGALSGGIAQAVGLADLGGSLDTNASWDTFGAPSFGASPSWLTTDAGTLVVGAGFYMLSLEVDIGWATGSAHDRVEVRLANSFGDGNAWNYAHEMLATTANFDGSRKGLRRVINWGHAILDDAYPLVLAMDFYGGSAGAGTLGRQSSSGAGTATWYIARLGDVAA